MSESTPICRCRVLYLGSSVPQQTKDGLQGIQEPLQELYPDQGATGARGIDSWLSVWSNGILLENVDENHKKITRFFPIESLHYCAAIRYVLVPEKNTLHNPSPRFLPLDSPFARAPNPVHPPLFAAILRRTTGIKVLECHAFICKREVAANALVRCCFHAYADSSYARQVDNTGSIYGTIAPSERISNKDKVEDWKMNRSTSGSTMTINTIGGGGDRGGGNAKDDVSIYNGDENHKVWAGSQDNLDGIYDVYATSTISRPNRPRQIAQPAVNVPPPPQNAAMHAMANPSTAITNGKEKNKKRNKKLLGGSKEDLYPLMNGATKANSVAGTMLKPRQGQHHHPHHQHHHNSNGPPPTHLMYQPAHQPHHQPPMYIMAHGPPPHPHLGGHAQLHGGASAGTLPNPKFFKQYGHTFSHRSRGGVGVGAGNKLLIPAPAARPIPPPLVPLAPIIIPTTMPKSRKKNSKSHQAMEEPIYLPSNRALSPVASYQPVNFPHEAYLMQQYATMESVAKQQQHHQKHLQRAPKDAKPSKLSKKLAQSMNGLDDPNLVVLPPAMLMAPPAQVHQQQQMHHQMGAPTPPPPPPPPQNGGAGSASPTDQSPYNTGIYRKKGHLNERAFSYSIRQEHRSRSYGSLANLKFATPIPNGVGGGGSGGGGGGGVSVTDQVEDREDMKKEREIMQMVHDLDLSGDEIERSEVPRGMYDPRPGPAPIVVAGPTQLNGRNLRR